jgi:hypothetical protein
MKSPVSSTSLACSVARWIRRSPTPDAGMDQVDDGDAVADEAVADDDRLD